MYILEVNKIYWSSTEQVEYLLYTILTTLTTAYILLLNVTSCIIPLITYLAFYLSITYITLNRHLTYKSHILPLQIRVESTIHRSVSISIISERLIQYKAASKVTIPKFVAIAREKSNPRSTDKQQGM